MVFFLKGDLLFRLAKKLRNSSSQSNNPINARFIGMDYCQDAIQLAKSLAQSRLEQEVKVEWVVDDALHVKNLTKSSIDIILDKVSVLYLQLVRENIIVSSQHIYCFFLVTIMSFCIFFVQKLFLTRVHSMRSLPMAALRWSSNMLSHLRSLEKMRHCFV